jgi:hypothetical protein
VLTWREVVAVGGFWQEGGSVVGCKPVTWTRIDCNYETLRINMRSLFHVLGVTTEAAAAAETHCVDRGSANA